MKKLSIMHGILKETLFNTFIIIQILITIWYVSNIEKTSLSFTSRLKDPKFKINGPYNTTKYDIQNNDTLFAVKDFKFTINPKVCPDENVFLAIIVASNPVNFERRSVIRQSWGQVDETSKVAFLIGSTFDQTTVERINKESLEYNDIVQGNFVDAYRNMTYKHVMGLKWVVNHCSKAKYVLKTDDDVVVNIEALNKFLVKELSPWGVADLIACKVLYSAPVMRAYKWAVSIEEYPDDFYPDYCLGPMIIYSQNVVPKLLSVAQKLPYYWIDDVFVTGIVANKTGIPRTPLGDLILDTTKANLVMTEGVEAAGQFLFGPIQLSTKMMIELWNSIAKRHT